MAFTEFDGELDKLDDSTGFKPFDGELDGAPPEDPRFPRMTPPSPARRGGTRGEAQDTVNVRGGHGFNAADPRRLDIAGNQPPAARAGASAPAYKSRLEALDDAVNLVEEGAQPARVFDAFGKMGITEAEIATHGAARKSPAFSQEPVGRQALQAMRDTPAPAPAASGSISAIEPSSTQEVVNTLLRGKEQAGGALDALTFQAGILSPDAMAARSVERARRTGAAAPSGDVAAGLERLTQANETGSWSKVLGEVASPSNWKALAALVAESAIGSSPMIASTLAGTALAGPAGGVAGAGIGSFSMEYASALGDTLDKHKVDQSSLEAVSRALNDPTLMAEARERGIRRGIPVAAFDALSAGFAGRFIRTVEKAADAGKIAAGAVPGAMVRAGGKEAVLQIGSDMAGEYGGQLATGERKPLDVLVEGLSGLPGGVVESAGNIRHARSLDPMRQMAGAIDADAAEATGSLAGFAQRKIEAYQPLAAEPASSTAGQPATPAQAPRPAVRVEDMPTQPLTPEQVAAITPAPQPAVKESKPAEGAPQPTVKLGGDAIQQGSLADIADQTLRERSLVNQPVVAGDAGLAEGRPDGSGAESVRSVGAVGSVAAEPESVVRGSAAAAARTAKAGAVEALDTSDPALTVEHSVEPFKTHGQALTFVVQNRMAQRVDVVKSPDGGFVLAPKAPATSGRVLQEDQAELTRLNQGLADAGWRHADGSPVVAQAVPDHEAPASLTAFQRIANAAFGIRVIAARGLTGLGIQYRGRAYVNVEQANSHELLIGTTGHEAFHWLEVNDPASANALVKGIAPLLRKDAVGNQLRFENSNLTTGEEPLNQEQGRAEVMANINGAMWVDPEFWGRLYELDNGSTFRKVLYQFARAATKLIKVARGTVENGAAYDVSQYVTDVAAVREVAARVWAERAQNRTKTPDAASLRLVQMTQAREKNYTHEVYDTKTGEVVGKYQGASMARRARDRKDQQYGAVRYAVREIAGRRPVLARGAPSAERQRKISEFADIARKELPDYAVDDAVELLQRLPDPPKADVPNEARQRLEAMIQPLIDEAVNLNDDFARAVRKLAGELGGRAMTAPVKSMRRSVEKLYEDEVASGRESQPGDIKDLVRASIVLGSEDDVPSAIAEVRAAMKVVRVKDRFATPLPTNYRDVLMNVELPGGMLAELQLHIPQMMAAKELGHMIYENYRVDPKAPGAGELERAQQRLYGAAYDVATGAEPKLSTSLVNSASDTGAPSRASRPTLNGAPVTAETADTLSGSSTMGKPSTSTSVDPLGRDFQSNTTNSFAGPTGTPILPRNARAVAEHKMALEREERATIKTVRLSSAEQALIDSEAARVAKEVGGDAKVIKAALRAAVTRHKAAHPVSQGWAPLNFRRAEVVKDDDGGIKLDEDGVPMVIPRYDEYAYAFHQDAAGKADAKTEDVRVQAMAKRLRNEALDLIKRRDRGDETARVILRQAGWYKNMRQRLRAEFGGFGDFFADLLGATSPNTPVRTNWEFSIEALRLASQGRYDDIMPAIGAWYDQLSAARDAADSYLQAQLAAGKTKVAVVGKKAKGGGWEREPDPAYAELAERAKAAEEYTGPQPMRENGKRFGINTNNVLLTLGNLWRTVEAGTAPKARNFSGNLIGFRTGATIDVWAARLLRRIARDVVSREAFPRIPPMAEKGVAGKHLSQDVVGGEFGFGQRVFHEAAAMLRDSGTPEFTQVGDDDLQAIVWFLEKELWTLRNWTTVSGEGGSFEQEADLAGSPERDRVRELRRIVDSTKSSPEMREAARAELGKLEGPLQRFVGGLSIQKSEENQGEASVPTYTEQHAVRARLEAAAGDTIAFRAFSTLGRYGADERSFDIEGVTRMGYDLAPLHAEMRRVAAEANQDSFFTAKALAPDAQVDYLVHRPGVEIYFRQPMALYEAEPVLAQLREKGVEFFTFITDGRRTPDALAGTMPKVVGVRVLALPEFSARYGDEEASGLASQGDDAARDYMRRQAGTMDSLAEAARQVPGVSYAEASYYEVNAEFREQYDGNDDRGAEGEAGGARREAWRGLTVREGLARADRRAGASAGAALQDGPADLRGDDRLAQSRAAGPAEPAGRPGPGGPAGVGRDAAQGRQGAVAGWHYGKFPGLARLTGQAYGSGIRGAEAQRLNQPGVDPRIKRRVYFYIQRDNGSLPAREAGLGPFRYEAQLDNLADTGNPEHMAQVREARKAWDDNGFESAVLDAGFDGYTSRSIGMAVVLNKDVPVEYAGPVGRDAGTAPAPAAPQVVKRALLSKEAAALEPRMDELRAEAPSATLRMGTLSFSEADRPAVEAFLAGQPRQARTKYAELADPFADGYKRLEGRKVSFQVRIEETGDVATFTVDAAQHLRDLDERADVMRRLLDCISR